MNENKHKSSEELKDQLLDGIEKMWQSLRDVAIESRTFATPQERMLFLRESIQVGLSEDCLVLLDEVNAQTVSKDEAIMRWAKLVLIASGVAPENLE